MPITERIQKLKLCDKEEKRTNNTNSKDKKKEMQFKNLTQPCIEVITHLFDLIKNKDTGHIKRDNAIEYLERAENRKVQADSDDVKRLMRGSKELGLDLEGFTNYFKEQCRATRDTLLYKHFKAYGIGKDLRRFSE